MDDLSLSDNMCYGLVGKSNVISGYTTTPSENHKPLLKGNIFDDIFIQDNVIYALTQATAVKSKDKKTIRKKHDNFKMDLFILILSILTVILSLMVIIACILMFVYARALLCDCTVMDSNNDNQTTTTTTVMTSNGSIATEEQMQLVVKAMDSVLRLEQDFEEIVKTYTREKMSTDSRLSVLSSSIQSINNTIQQLRIQATNTCSILSQLQSITEPVELKDLGNQTCPVNTTKLNQPATITIDNDCTIRTGSVCIIQPPGLSCITFNVVKFIQDNQILVDFECYVESSSNIVNGTASVRQDSIINTTPNQDIYDHFVEFTGVGCSCLSLGGDILKCNFFAKHCNYERETINSVINT